MQRMLSMRDLKAQDLHGLTPDAVKALAAQMLEHIEHQASELERRQQLIEVKQQRDRAQGPRHRLARRQAGEGQLRARSAEALEVRRQDRSDDAEQRRLFEETLAEDEASLQAQLERLREEAAAAAAEAPAKPKDAAASSPARGAACPLATR
jgi:transposase